MTYRNEYQQALKDHAYATAVGGPIYGLPYRDGTPNDMHARALPGGKFTPITEETGEREPDKRGSRLTAPGRLDADVRLAQFIRLSGSRGVAPLAWYGVTAQGKATHTPNLSNVGGCPAEQEHCDPARIGVSDMTKTRRYVPGKVPGAGKHDPKRMPRGEQFVAGMARAGWTQNAPDGSFAWNDHGFDAWHKAAFPYWPIDAAGSSRAGRIGKHGIYFDIGGERITLARIYAGWLANEGAETAAASARKSAREADELSALIAAQELDDAGDRRRTVATGMIGR